MSAYLVLVARIFINVWRYQYRELFFPGGQRDRASDLAPVLFAVFTISSVETSISGDRRLLDES